MKTKRNGAASRTARTIPGLFIEVDFCYEALLSDEDDNLYLGRLASRYYADGERLEGIVGCRGRFKSLDNATTADVRRTTLKRALLWFYEQAEAASEEKGGWQGDPRNLCRIAANQLAR